MNAIRCMECGDTRWSLFSLGSRDPGACELCGGQMTRERRRPERGARRQGAERRDLGVHELLKSTKLRKPPSMRPSA